MAVVTPAATGSRYQPVDITVADIARVIDGPLADVHGVSPEMFGPPGVAAPTKELWIAVRAALRSVMEQVTIADLAARNRCRPTVAALLDDPDAWIRRPDPVQRSRATDRESLVDTRRESRPTLRLNVVARWLWLAKPVS